MTVLCAGYASAQQGSFYSQNYSSGLVGWWKLCGNSSASSGCNASSSGVAYDSSGNGNNGNWIGVPSGILNFYAAGHIGPWAGFFNGAENAVSLTAPGQVTSALNGSWSVTMWTNIASGSGYLFSSGGSAHGRVFGTNTQGCAVGNICAAEEGVSAIGCSIPYTTNAWRMIAYTYDGTTLRGYVNGVPICSAPYTYSSSYSGTYEIGNTSGSLVSSVNDVRVYNYALDAAEIALSARPLSITNPVNVVLSANLSNVISGLPVKLTVAVTGQGSTPTGTITFTSTSTGADRGVLGKVNLNSGGVATYSGTVWAGVDSITALYSGDENHSGAASNAVVVTSATLNGKLKFNTQYIAFPTPVAYGGVQNWPVTLTNLSGTTIAQPSFAWTGSGAANFSIASNQCLSFLRQGASCSLNVVFNPTTGGSSSGTLSSAMLTATTATSASNIAALTVSGTVLSDSIGFNSPVLALSPAGISGSTPWPVLMTNRTSKTLTGISFQFSNGNNYLPGSFTIKSNCPSIAPGANCLFQVTSTPIYGQALGAYSSMLQVSGRDGVNLYYSPQLPVSGTVLTQRSFGINWNQDLQNGVSTIDFGKSNSIGVSTTPWPIVVTNFTANTQTLTLTPSSSQFAVSHSTCTSVATGGTCSFDLTFTPTANGYDQTDTLTITGSVGGNQYTFNTWGGASAYAAALTATVQLLPALPSLTSTRNGQKIWYVSSQHGNNAYNGSSTFTPFHTINKALSVYKGGDMIVIMPGNYNESVTLLHGGTASNYTILMGQPGAAMPTITSSSGIKIGASYVRVSGINSSGSGVEGIGIYVVDPAPTQNSDGYYTTSVHHVILDHNLLHDSGCSGIKAENTDYLMVWGNSVYENARFAPEQCSGIGVNTSINFDGNASVYHVEVVNNSSYANYNDVAAKSSTLTCPNTQPSCNSNGDGIRLDRNSQYGYTGKMLVFGNAVYRNGGNGIAVLHSESVDVVNNTAYSNALDQNLLNYPSGAGEFVAQESSNLNFVNNIADAAGMQLPVGVAPYALVFDHATNSTWRNGLSVNGSIFLNPVSAANINPVTAVSNYDPEFVGVPYLNNSPWPWPPACLGATSCTADNPLITSTPDFHLQMGSQAIHAGTILGQAGLTDMLGNPIPAQVQINLGAIQ